MVTNVLEENSEYTFGAQMSRVRRQTSYILEVTWVVVITKDRRGTRYRDMSRPGKCNGRISEHRTIKIQPFLWSLKTVKESF